MTKEEAEALQTFKHSCTCGGYAWRMNGRSQASPHMDWCPQAAEHREWWEALHPEIQTPSNDGSQTMTTTPSPTERPRCAVRGLIRPNAMCGSIIVGGTHCGFGGECSHKLLGAQVEIVRQDTELYFVKRDGKARPGNFADEATARAALLYSDEVLKELQAAAAVAGSIFYERFISAEALAAAPKAEPC